MLKSRSGRWWVSLTNLKPIAAKKAVLYLINAPLTCLPRNWDQPQFEEAENRLGRAYRDSKWIWEMQEVDHSRSYGTSPAPLCWAALSVSCWLQVLADNCSNWPFCLEDCPGWIEAATTRDFWEVKLSSPRSQLIVHGWPMYRCDTAALLSLSRKISVYLGSRAFYGIWLSLNSPRNPTFA